MKTINCPLLCLLLAFLIAQSVSAQGESEPNNSYAQADPIALGSSINGSFKDRRDKDVFRFTIDQPGVASFSVSPLPKGISANLTLYDAEGNFLKTTGTFSGSVLMDELVCEPGPYYLWVQPVYGKPVNASYTIETSFNTKDIYECNETFADAALVDLQTSISAQLLDKGDDDVYTFKVEQEGVVGFKTVLPAGISANLTLYGPKGDFLESTGTFSDSTYLDELVCDSGYYYLWVKQIYGKPVDELYTIEIGFNTKDVYECNETFADAALVDLQTSISAQLLDKGDDDVYTFKVEQEGVVGFKAVLPAGISANLTLYGPKGDFLESTGTFSDSTYLDELVCDSGYYYLWVKQIYGKPVDELYTIEIGFNTKDIYECNETFADAALVDLQTSISAQLLDKGDDDVYTFKVEQEGVVGFKAVLPAGIRANLTLYGPKGDFLESTGTFSDSTYLDELVCDSGYYYLWVKQIYGKPVDELYTIEIDFNTKDVYECNETFAEAALVPMQSTISAQLLDEEDNDVYTFEAIGSGRGSFNMVLPAGISATMTLYDTEGNFIKTTGTFSGNANMNAMLCEAGYYYLWVKQIYGKPVDELYTLEIGFDNDDPYECNDTFADAIPFLVNCDAVTGQIFDKRDVDFFEFYVTENETYWLRAEQIPKDAKITLSLYDEDESYIRKYTGGINEAFQMVYTTESSGTRYLKITSSRSSKDNYVVSISDEQCMADVTKPAGIVEHYWRSNHTGEVDPAPLSEQPIRFPQGNFQICADGSASSLFVFKFEDPGVYNLEHLSLRIAEDPDAEDIKLFGGFTDIRLEEGQLKAVFKHPEYLFNSKDRYKTYNIELYEKNGDATISSYSLRVYRAPVLLVHGRAADKTTFQPMEAELLAGRKYHDIQINNVDYSLASNDRFLENNWVIPSGLDKLFDDLKKFKIAAGSADIVSHSMGGILARLYIQGADFRNDIHKLITCNTPHFGSQIANLLMDTRLACATEIYCGDVPVGEKCFGGAVVDLQVWSEAMQLVNSGNSAGVPVHAITTIKDPKVYYPIQSPIVKKPSKANLLRLMSNILTVVGTQRFKLEINDLFNLDDHDFVVSDLSQRGGLLVRDHFTRISDQWHPGSVSNPQVIKAVDALLAKDPNGESFTKDGFKSPPAGFGYKYKPLFACPDYEVPMTLEFVEPREDKAYIVTDEMTIKVVAQDKNVKQIRIIAQEYDDQYEEVITVNADEVETVYTVPSGAEDWRRLEAYGYDALGELIAKGEGGFLVIHDDYFDFRSVPERTSEEETVRTEKQSPDSAWSRSLDRKIDLANAQKLSIYPSPAIEQVTLAFRSERDQQNVSLAVYNPFGQLVSQKNINVQRGENRVELKTDHLSAGLYWVVLRDGRRQISGRLVRQ